MKKCTLKTLDKKVEFNFFLDYSKGIMVDLSKCIDNKNIMLSEVRYLCDNVTSLKEKNNDYYLDNYKYLNKYEVERYLDETFEELGKKIIKKKTYLCLKHHGKYENRIDTYKKLLEEVKLNNYKINGIPIEQYIKGSWNEKDENKYITNIMIPIEL